MRRFRSRISLVLVALSCSCARLPEFADARAQALRSASDTRILDRTGQLLQTQRSDAKIRRLGWIPLAEVSPRLREAVLRSEDRRFYRHGGIDWRALAGAFWQGRGGSTITMQLASRLDPALRPVGRHRGAFQKLRQCLAALRLERTWSKSQVLEAYLNLVSFRGELEGIESASRGLFGKAPGGLDREESLLLAALIRAPGARDAKVRERACRLGRALDAGYDCQALGEVGRLRLRPIAPAIALAPHAARLVAHGPGEVRTTLDRGLQEAVNGILRRQVLAFRDRNLQDAAALVLDNASGEVRAYVGSVGDLSRAGQVDGVRARRQAGSALKPFIYTLAIENRYLTAGSPMDDSEADIPLGSGSVYRPRDFDREYHGADVRLRAALASSLNLPAVRALGIVGVERLLERLRALGFGALRSEEYYGPSLALGTADVTLWELTNAYRALARGGLYSEARLVAGGEGERRVFGAAPAFIVSDILSDRNSRSLTFGLESPLALPFWAAAKTGTSKDMRDNWCVGFSRKYTVGVWAGNFSGAPMWNVSGISGAAPAWAEIMEALGGGEEGGEPPPPAGLSRVGGEWYLAGTEPRGDFRAARSAQARIAYPVEGLLIARDPDIPPARQRVFFTAKPESAAFRWKLNGRELARADLRGGWMPGRPGKYELRLTDQGGKELDTVHFAVRGGEEEGSGH